MIAYDRSTALVVVDVQNDFADPAGSLYVPGGEAVPGAVNAEIARARAAGALVAFTQDWHPPETPHFVTGGGVWPVHCVRGSWGAELHPELDAAPGEPVIRKGADGEDGYSGFRVADPRTGAVTSTGLEERLREAGVTKVVVAGLATDYCVRDTALDACRSGFATTVLTGAIRAVDLTPGDGEAALKAMREAGVMLA
ncbi:MAG TPA: isochorismatase family protein [Actinomycetota bacterium]|nr:isochorismatase family protein [Actinomycetota bacterium]